MKVKEHAKYFNDGGGRLFLWHKYPTRLCLYPPYEYRNGRNACCGLVETLCLNCVGQLVWEKLVLLTLPNENYRACSVIQWLWWSNCFCWSLSRWLTVAFNAVLKKLFVWYTRFVLICQEYRYKTINQKIVPNFHFLKNFHEHNILTTLVTFVTLNYFVCHSVLGGVGFESASRESIFDF